MQFQHPEILYFLWLLIIPILVHLFQLQKFVKVPFTNVAFLKKIIQDSRKSSRVKKWLILATRMLLFSAILFAFAKPYFSLQKATEKQQIFIYIDNSLSTQAIGEKGSLLQVAANEIIENAPKENTFSLMTNDDFYEDISFKELKNYLLDLKNSSTIPSISRVLLQLNNLSKNKTTTSYKPIILSDFQNCYKSEFTNVTSQIWLHQLSESQKNNLSIDSVFTTSSTTDAFQLNIIVKNQGDQKNNIPIALFDAKILISKQSFSIDKNSQKTITFSLQKKEVFQGKISLTFSDTFLFDNTFFFSKKTPKKIRVLAIGNDTDFLSKIYTNDEFEFTINSSEKIDFNILKKQELIILQGLEKISEILSKSLQDFLSINGSIVVIPNKTIDVNSYNQFLQKNGNPTISSKIVDTLKISKIIESHPFFSNVFSKKIENFQHPTVNHFFEMNMLNASKMVLFENDFPFLGQFKTSKGALYLFASSIDKVNSSFQNSPLIVPIFYNFGKFSFQQSQLYYYLDQENKIDVDIQLQKDDILEISTDENSFIPSQQTFQNKVTITTKEMAEKPGIFGIKKQNELIETIGFNTPKNESSMYFFKILDLKNSKPTITIANSIADFFKNIEKNNEVQLLWKWFLALAIVSLFLEILILKFYKP